MLLIGFHAIKNRLNFNPKSIEKIFISSKKKDFRKDLILQLAKKNQLKVILTDQEELNKLSSNKKNNGFLAFAEKLDTPETVNDLFDFLAVQKKKSLPPLIFLDGVTDPRNLGALLRSADAGGTAAVIAPMNHSAPLNDLALKTSVGATEGTFYLRVPNLSRAIEIVQMRGYFVYGMDSTAAKNLYSLDLRSPVAFVFGDEAGGLKNRTRDMCDDLISLPMVGVTESLNVSVACGVTIFETLRQRRFN